jgi:ubiquinone biosynthesis accessory factor UbiJ
MKLFFETLLALAQNAVNDALALDPVTKKSLSQLQNRFIAIHIENLSAPLYIHIHQEQIFFSLRAPQTLDLTLRAKAKDLWHLSQKNQTPSQHIEIQGNMHIAQQLGKMMHDFDPDWEEMLTQKMGDVPGHALAQTLRHAHAYGKQLGLSIMQNSADYMVDEQPMIAAKSSIDTFIHDVDSVRTRCDRLATRVHLLINKASV